MKSIKHVALAAFMTLSAFCAVLYSSCSKDACKDVVCQNGGTCADGNCTCATGYEGTRCETVARLKYVNTYVGNGTDNATPSNSYTGFRAVVTATGTDVTKLQLVLQDNTTTPVVALPITLTTFTATNSTFTITSTSASGYTYTGSGTISATVVSLTLVETANVGGGVITYNFPTMTKL
ncbi:MAG: calcium-binding EGF-like domain-containing protein [Bacteroidota bacterium]